MMFHSTKPFAKSASLPLHLESTLPTCANELKKSSSICYKILSSSTTYPLLDCLCLPSFNFVRPSTSLPICPNLQPHFPFYLIELPSVSCPPLTDSTIKPSQLVSVLPAISPQLAVMVEEDTDDLQRQRKMEENEAAFLNSIQTVNHGQSGGNDSGEQIDSSDEYDPAQDVQDISLTASNQAPVTDSPHASRPASAHSTNVSATQAANQQPGPESSMQPSVIQSPSTTSTVKPNGTPFASQPPQAMLPRVRLPHDTVGILEDRIKEDEKGDTEAWLSLINEYKRRGKIDEVRKVYDRFFAVFPQTVSLVSVSSSKGGMLTFTG